MDFWAICFFLNLQTTADIWHFFRVGK